MFKFRVTGGKHVDDFGNVHVKGDTFTCNRRIDTEMINKFEYLGEVQGSVSQTADDDGTMRDVTSTFPLAVQLGYSVWFEGRGRYFISPANEPQNYTDEVAMKKRQVQEWLEEQKSPKEPAFEDSDIEDPGDLE